MKTAKNVSEPWPRLALTSLIGVLLLCLTGCGEKLVVHRVKIPTVLTSQVKIPDVEPTNNGELLDLYLDTRHALIVCNGQLQDIEDLNQEQEQ